MYYMILYQCAQQKCIKKSRQTYYKVSITSHDVKIIIPRALVSSAADSFLREELFKTQDMCKIWRHQNIEKLHRCFAYCISCKSYSKQ